MAPCYSRVNSLLTLIEYFSLPSADALPLCRTTLTMADFEVEARLGDGSYSEVLQVPGLTAGAGACL